jgi:WD40 repeat protein
VEGLGGKHRLPVILRYVNGLTVPEIASIMNLSQGTVHSRLFSANRKLREPLGVTFSGLDKTASHLSFSPDGTSLAATARDGSLVVWDVSEFH